MAVGAKFKPSPTMSALADAARSKGYAGSISEWCAIASEAMGGTSSPVTIRRDWYEFWQRPGFAAWWREGERACRGARVAAAKARLYSHIDDPAGVPCDVPAVKLALEADDEDYAPRTRTRNSTQLRLPDLHDMSDDELEAWEHVVTGPAPTAPLPGPPPADSDEGDKLS